MRKLILIAPALVLAACATTPSAPAGMEAGKFVSFTCEGGPFQARWNPDGNTVRVRSHHGAAELAPTDGGYAGDGFALQTSGKDGMSLSHAGKTLGKNCKKA
jgi:hypothetical protein